jgi:hypothetical protein
VSPRARSRRVDPNKTCFLVCPIGEAESETRRRSDHWAKYIVNHVLAEFGYVVPAKRADDLAKPGQITRQIIEQIRDAHLVVADLTDENPNVFYELALRHVANTPVILFRGEDVPPFDVGGLRAISYRVDDLEFVDEAREAFRGHVAHVESHYEAVGQDNPVGSALEFGELVRTGEPRDAVLAQVLEEVRNLAGVVNALGRPKQSSRTLGSFTLPEVGAASDLPKLRPIGEIDTDALNRTLQRLGAMHVNPSPRPRQEPKKPQSKPDPNA